MVLGPVLRFHTTDVPFFLFSCTVIHVAIGVAFAVHTAQDFAINASIHTLSLNSQVSDFTT